MSEITFIMPSLTSTLVPKRKDVLLARKSSQLLSSGPKSGHRKIVALDINGRRVLIPASIGKVVAGALHDFAEGKSITVVSQDEEMSPQQAAEILNVSRPFAAKLFDQGAIPSRKVGTHRRALARDVLAYKRKTDTQRRKALDELIAQAQELDMGY